MKYLFTVQEAYDEIEKRTVDELIEWKKEIEDALTNNVLHQNDIEDNKFIANLIDEELKNRN